MLIALKRGLAALVVLSPLCVMLLLGSTVACRRIEEAARPAVGARFAVVYSTNMDGDIEPCG